MCTGKTSICNVFSPFLEPFSLYFSTCLTTFSILTWETVLWLFQSHQFCHHRRGVGVVHIIASWGGFCGWDLKFGKTVVQGVPPCVTRGVLWVSFAVKRLRWINMNLSRITTEWAVSFRPAWAQSVYLCWSCSPLHLARDLLCPNCLTQGLW